LRQGKVLANDRVKVTGSDCSEHTAVKITEQLSLERLHYGGLFMLKLGRGKGAVLEESGAVWNLGTRLMNQFYHSITCAYKNQHKCVYWGGSAA
jgi:hypothetical protein